MQEEADRSNFDAVDVFVRESVALGRMMKRKQTTEFVVQFYGAGRMKVEVNGRVRILPWLAIEYVDGGAEGVTLTERVRLASGEGVTPARALRLLAASSRASRRSTRRASSTAISSPTTCSVTGPVGEEIPKLADCGIARVEGLFRTVAAVTPAYGGPEQKLSRYGERKPAHRHLDRRTRARRPGLVHPRRRAVVPGRQRRRLAARQAPQPAHRAPPAPRLPGRAGAARPRRRGHRRGASQRLPSAVLAAPGVEPYLDEAQRLFPSMFVGEERFPTAAAFGEALLPLLERVIAAWEVVRANEDRAALAFRKAALAGRRAPDAPLAETREFGVMGEAESDSSLRAMILEPALPRRRGLPADGKVLVRFGVRLLYFVGDKPHRVALSAEHRELVIGTRWLVRGPVGGFALVGPAHVLLIRGSSFSSMELPRRRDGGPVGEIQAVINSGPVFGVITATNEGRAGAELWTSTDGVTWSAPRAVSLGGEAQSASSSAAGVLVVGSYRGAKARARFLPLEPRTEGETLEVQDRPPLRVALCGPEGEAWAAGWGFVLSCRRGAVTFEMGEDRGAPAAMGFDPLGVPWLVTDHAVMRRHVEGGVALWKTYYRREDDRASLIAVGFTPEGARVLDERATACRSGRATSTPGRRSKRRAGATGRGRLCRALPSR